MLTDKELNPENWVDVYSDKLYRYTFTRVSDSGLAEDIVQETFLSAWRSRSTYKGQASEINWLYAICKNKIIDHFRNKAKNLTNFSSNDEDIYFNEAEHWRDSKTPKEWGINYHLPVETKEFFTVLEECKNKLKDVQQQVFVMKFMQDLDASEICKVLNLTSSNYWVLIHRCKLNLRNCLEKNWLNIDTDV